MYYIDTTDVSKAVEGIRLGLMDRTVEIEWTSGHRSNYQLSRREQWRFLFSHLNMNPDLSYGRWANAVKNNTEFCYD